MVRSNGKRPCPKKKAPSKQSLIEENLAKKQTRISSYFQKATKTPDDELSTALNSRCVSDDKVAKTPNKKLSTVNFRCVSDDKVAKTPKEKLSTRFNSRCVSDDSDIEIIEATPRAPDKSLFILNQNNDSISDIIPPTPEINNTKSIFCNTSRCSNSISQEPVNSFIYMSKPNNVCNKLKDGKFDLGNSLKRTAECGLGISPNAKRNTEVSVEKNSDSCKVNILSKLDSSQMISSDSEASFCLLNSNSFVHSNRRLTESDETDYQTDNKLLVSSLVSKCQKEIVNSDSEASFHLLNSNPFLQTNGKLTEFDETDRQTDNKLLVSSLTSTCQKEIVNCDSKSTTCLLNSNSFLQTNGKLTESDETDRQTDDKLLVSSLTSTCQKEIVNSDSKSTTCLLNSNSFLQTNGKLTEFDKTDRQTDNKLLVSSLTSTCQKEIVNSDSKSTTCLLNSNSFLQTNGKLTEFDETDHQSDDKLLVTPLVSKFEDEHKRILNVNGTSSISSNDNSDSGIIINAANSAVTALPSETKLDEVSNFYNESNSNMESEMLDLDEISEIENELQLDFDKFSPFKDENNVQRDKTQKTIERVLSDGVDDESFSALKKFNRFVVVSVSRMAGQREVILHMKSLTNGVEKLCILTGFWLDSVVKEGDIVHVLFTIEEEGKFVVSNEQGMIVVNPDYLMSGTSVVKGVFCRRKAVLSERFKDIDSSNMVMVIGSLVHQLFQKVIECSSLTKANIGTLAESLVRQPQFLKELYGMDLSEEKICEEIKKFIPTIHKWINVYLKDNGQVSCSKSIGALQPKWCGTITDVKDIEENIWSPRFGVKGKVDLTVQALSKNTEKAMPLELKTGKSSFSAEHKGQVILYTMMMSDRIGSPDSGLLLYLRDGTMSEIEAKDREKKGLIQLRNELVQYLARRLTDAQNNTLPSLPEPLDSRRSCSNCEQLLQCSLNLVVNKEVPHSPHAMSTLAPETVKHLSEAHIEYFRRWCLMLHLESGSLDKSASIRALWCKDPLRREASGSSIINLKLNAIVEEIEVGSFLHKMIRKTESSSSADSNLPQNFQVGDMIVVSSKQELALSTGVVYEMKEDSVTVVLDSDWLEKRLIAISEKIGLERFLKRISRRDLSVYDKKRICCLHLDRCEYQNSMSSFFTNLARLLGNDPRSERLRQLIIEKQKPQFMAGVSREVVVKIKIILKILNKEQQRAVLRVLQAKDFTILKGYPGTGKTSTIVGLIRLLNATGHSVLVTSYTHSAVDNILLKLKVHEDVNFLRLGRTSRIHKDILNYSDEILTRKLKSLEEMNSFYSNMKVVASTCLGMNHPIFKRRSFDYCIIDEASQVLEAACLGPLFHCRSFALVGDSLQLPPIVRNMHAKMLGMKESLLERLDVAGQISSICLTLQYRMNEPIMQLANNLTYGGKLTCADEELKTATLKLPKTMSSSGDEWLRRCLSSSLEDSVLFFDTLGEAIETRDAGDQLTNSQEAMLVLSLTKAFQECGASLEDIGVITPYRGQVKLLKERSQSKFRDFLQLEINTVDQFQGRDKEIVLYSCVRSGLGDESIKENEILNDSRRLNVAITRAKRKLIIIGHRKSLSLYIPFKRLFEALNSSQFHELRERSDEFKWDF